MKKSDLRKLADKSVGELLSRRAQEIQGYHDDRRSRTTAMVAARNQLFTEGLEALFQQHPFPKAQTYRPAKSTKKTERILNVMLSDLHYGADLDSNEVGSSYGPVEEARRTAAVATQVADYKRHYRAETILYVHLLGDLIQGKLHDPESAAPLTEQFYRAVWILGQTLRFWAGEFKQVVVRCTPGNHGRRMDRHPDRAVNQKWDSIESMIYGSLQFALADLKNVEVQTFLKPFYVYEAFGIKGFMTHGDTVLKPGYPGRSLNVESVRKQVNEINIREHCGLFGVGHVHVGSSVRLPNNVVFLTNGCLIPSDEFAVSIGIMETACCQQIWESVPGFIYGDRRDAIVDASTDQERSFDKIIKPFPGMTETSRIRR